MTADAPAPKCACGKTLLDSVHAPATGTHIFTPAPAPLCAKCGRDVFDAFDNCVRCGEKAPPPSADGEAGKVHLLDETVQLHEEIAALRAEVDAWKVAEVETRKVWKARADKAEAEVERLKTYEDGLMKTVEDLGERVAELTRERDEARARAYRAEAHVETSTVRALKARVAFLSSLIEAAPHGVLCHAAPAMIAFDKWTNGPCDCWKSKALEGSAR